MCGALVVCLHGSVCLRKAMGERASESTRAREREREREGVSVKERDNGKDTDIQRWRMRAL